MFNLNIVSETTPKMFFFILPSQKYCPFRSKVSSHTCLTVGNLDRQQILRHFPGIHFSKNFSFGTLQAIIERISPSAIFPCNFEQVRDYTLKTSCITSIPCSTSQFCSWCSWLHTYPGPWKHQQIDLESPSHLFFPCHTWFFLAVNELNLTFLMVLLGSVFLLGWGMEHHTRRWSSIGWIRWLVAAGDLNLRSWINGPRKGGVLVDFWIFFVYNMSYVLCFLLRISTCINYSINACLYMVT